MRRVFCTRDLKLMDLRIRIARCLFDLVLWNGGLNPKTVK